MLAAVLISTCALVILYRDAVRRDYDGSDCEGVAPSMMWQLYGEMARPGFAE